VCSAIGQWGSKKDERGLALIGVLFLTALLLALGAFGTSSAVLELRIAANERAAAQAASIAEAGARHAFSLLRTGRNFDAELSDGGTGGLLASIGELRTVDGVKYRYAPFGTADDGYYVRLIDNYDETSGADNPLDDNDRLVRIISRGQVGNTVRTLELAINVSGPGWGIFGKNHIDLKKDGFTDSWDSRDGQYALVAHGQYGSVASNGDVKVHEMRINGDATAGKKVTKDAAGVVTGTITNNNFPLITLDPDPVPVCGPPYSDGTGISGTFAYNQNKGELRVKGKKQAALAPGSYCFKKISMDDGALLTITGPGATIVYLTEDGNFEKGIVRNLTHVPANFQLRSSRVGGGTSMHLGTTGGEMYAVSYAPGARTTVRKNGDFYGMIVGRCVHFEDDHINFHYDEALGISDLALKRYDWREIRNE
jgi:hypothetical protein